MEKETTISDVEKSKHVALALYGVYLQTYQSKFLKVIGVCIVYQHLIYTFSNVPRIPKEVLMLGGLIGATIGLVKRDKMISIPLLYSFLSKFPAYAVKVSDQIRVIIIVILIQIIVDYFIEDSKQMNKLSSIHLHSFRKSVKIPELLPVHFVMN